MDSQFLYGPETLDEKLVLKAARKCGRMAQHKYGEFVINPDETAIVGWIFDSRFS